MPGRVPLPDDIKDLIALVKAGKLFAIQKWIADGKRTVSPRPYWTTPLREAVKTGFHSMIEVLVAAEVDQHEKDYLLRRAAWCGNLELIELFAQHGANLHAAGFEHVCRTGDANVMRYFLDRGIDAVTGQPFARALCHPSKPMLRIYFEYRKRIPKLRRQLNLALRYHARKGNLGWVCLLMWAGGNPRLRLPDIGKDSVPHLNSTALEEAFVAGHTDILNKIGIDPAKDNLGRLLNDACLLGRAEMIEKLVAMGANLHGDGKSYSPMDRTISRLLWQMEPDHGHRSEFKVLDALRLVYRVADLGGRWTPDGSDIACLRREMWHFDAVMVAKIIRGFHTHQVCTPEVLLKLLDHPKIKALLGVGHAKLVRMVQAPPPKIIAPRGIKSPTVVNKSTPCRADDPLPA